MTSSGLTREARKAETKEALFRAAAKLFSRDGIEATSVERVAAELGLTKGAVYAHFSSKQELVLALAHRIENDMDQSRLLEMLFDGSLSLEERLAKVGRESARLTEEGILGLDDKEATLLDLEYFIYGLRNRDPEFGATQRRTYEELGARIEAIQNERGEPLAFAGSTFFPLGTNLFRGIQIAHAQVPDLVPATLYEELGRAIAKILLAKPKGKRT